MARPAEIGRHMKKDMIKVMDKIVKDVILTEKEKIVDRAVDAAARKLAYGSEPKVIQKLAKEAARDD